MSTTPPTKQCPTCGSDDPRLMRWLNNAKGYDCPDPFHGTGVVAAEHSRTIVAHGTTTHYLDEPCEFCDSADNSHDEPAPAHPAPTAETEPLIHELSRLGDSIYWVCRCGYETVNDDAADRHSMLPNEAPTPPAATDDEVMAILDEFIGEGMLQTPVTFRFDALTAALEAHYKAKDAARFERAIGEDGDNWPDSEVNGEEDFRQALAEESQNKLRAEARSRYYGEQAGKK